LGLLSSKFHKLALKAPTSKFAFHMQASLCTKYNVMIRRKTMLIGDVDHQPARAATAKTDPKNISLHVRRGKALDDCG